ncbi:MAG: T9SS type A sorting domain-containing protein [Cryomorphaceae bacterium]
MKKIYSSIVFLITCFTVSAQTIHDVSVFNFGFDPATVEIQAGDIVRWVNTDGNHNVNGNTSDFPENTESFGNDVGPAGWTYEYQFNNAGTFNYNCILHSQMVGEVIVAGVNSTSDKESGVLSAYPTPAEDFVTIGGLENYPGQSQLIVFDITGKKALETIVSANEQIAVSSLKAGIYLFNLTTESDQRFTGKMLIK